MRLALITLALSLLPTLAFAVVMPDEEWFEEPGNEALWHQMWPTLNKWEFADREQLAIPVHESFAGIQLHMGLPNAEVASALGVEADSSEVLRFDLNRDNRVDQFDLLELGFEPLAPQKSASIAPSEGTNKWLVLRADFQNQNASYATYDIDYFEERFFDVDATKPSAHDYYNEVSYGALSIEGGVPNIGDGGDGWYKGDHNKSWYISYGGRWLVQEAVLAADDVVDFSEYDVDGDGYVDTCLLYYPNVAFSGGLWPHRSSGLNIHVDGVIVDSYFLSGYNTSNDSHTMTIAVHEYGHILGLPDLYDIDYSSRGMGKWSLMASNYDNDQLVPSPDPWCKLALGWVTPTVITGDVTGYNLGCYQDDPLVLKIWTNGLEVDQYFLVANYRQKLTDTNRLGEGLLVLHIDDSIGGGNQDNKNENRKHVDVESARGYNNPGLTNPKDPLDAKQDQGHANDLWFDGNSDGDYTGIFDDDANPFARNYPNPGSDTYISLSNISASADTMTLDIVVETSDAPSCTITAPSSGAVSGDVTIDVDATAADGYSIEHVTFFCNDAYLGEDDTAPYSLTFDTRSIYEGSRVITAIATDDKAEINADTVTVTVGNSAVAMPFTEDFESGIGQWAVYDPQGNRRWEAKALAYAGSGSAGIGSTSSGYDYNEHDSLVSIRFDLTGATHPIARWHQRYRVASGENTCKVWVTDDDGASFDLITTYGGGNLNWHPAAVDLEDYVGSEIHIVFKLDSTSLNRISSDGGWWIDELEIHELSAPPSITGITPGDGSTLTGVETITVTATDDEGVMSVEFWINDDDLIHVDYTEPFTFEWNSDWVFDGSHDLTAIAYDADLQSDSLTVGWTTSNSGLSLPFTEYFTTDPADSWRMIDESGSGEWQWLSAAGYNAGGMRFAIPGASYHDNMDNDWYISPTIDLTGADDPGLGFLHKFDIEQNYDYGRVYITTDLTTWSQLAVFSNENEPWQAAGARLDSYIGDSVKLAFFFESDGGLVEGGWWLDEVFLRTAPSISDVTPDAVVVGDTITITGTGFGDGSTGDFPQVLVSGYTASTSNWTDTSITAVVPYQSPSGLVKVVRHGIASDGVSITVRLAPPSIVGIEQL